MRTHRGVRKWIGILVCLLALAGVPGGAGTGGLLGVGAAGAQELEIEHDARLEGYDANEKVTLDGGNNAMLWLAFGFLAAVTLLGLFKDAKRSHLD